MNNTGRFMVVEGLEGAGKSTAVQTIKSYLENKVSSVLITREPGGTHVGETVRKLIKDSIPGEELDPRSELLLFYAARTQLYERVIRPALNRGVWVIADRFELSTYAYQGGARGISTTILDSLSSFCLGGFKPDHIFFLDIDPKKGLDRVKKRGEMDRIEQESLDFFVRVNQAYHQTMKNLDNVSFIDANQDEVSVQQALIAELERVTGNHYVSG